MRALFLCTEIAGYFANCIRLFSETNGTDVMTVYVPNGPDAPFQVDLPHVELINRRSIDGKLLHQKCFDFKPEIVYVIGWTDQDYLRICKTLKRKGVPVISGLDNAWTGSPRQRIASWLSFIAVKPYFTHLWVAGRRQYQFALRLGYSYENILTGMYAADIEKFSAIRDHPSKHYLLYVGRFEEIKGIKSLYEAFTSLTDHERNGWTLRMIGNGSLKNQFSPTKHIEIFDFLQPDELIPFAADAGGFILPSVQEPWGVVVQEFGAAGKPLLLSEAVNSAEDYLIHQYNGYVFQPNNAKELKSALVSFFNLSDKERKIMGARSHELAYRNTPEFWVAKFTSIKKPGYELQ